jgi:hypothetical protein
LKKIKTFSTIKYSENIKPAKSFIPEWYKDSSRYVGNNDKLQVSLDGNSNPGIKLCSPFLDSLTTGYIATLWQDIYVEKTELGSSIRWRPSQHEKHIESSDSPVNERPRRNGPAEHLPTPAGHQEQHFAWLHPYTFELPEGYSAIVTHPLNRFDLPFTTLSGVVDADLFPMVPGNIPFFLQKGFNGVIPKGTPFAHVFPYKRDKWSMSISKVLQARAFFDGNIDRSQLGYYKKKYWNRKNYN